MLKLSLRQGETIKLGENIKIRLTTVSANRIKVEIEAPREVAVWRETQGMGAAGKDEKNT